MNRDQYIESLIKAKMTREEAEELAKGAFPESVEPASTPAESAADAAIDALEKGTKAGAGVGPLDDPEDDPDEPDDDDDEDYVVPVNQKKAMKGLVLEALTETLEPLIAELSAQQEMVKGASAAQGDAFGASLAAYKDAAVSLAKGVKELSAAVTALRTDVAEIKAQAAENAESLAKGLKLPLPPKSRTDVDVAAHPGDKQPAASGGEMTKGSPEWKTLVAHRARNLGPKGTTVLRAIENGASTDTITAAAVAVGLSV